VVAVRAEVVVAPAEVDVTIVVALEVVLAFEVVGPGDPLPVPEHPIRLDPMAISSYQKVLAAEP
jgi:hypothetical protein